MSGVNIEQLLAMASVDPTTAERLRAAAASSAPVSFTGSSALEAIRADPSITLPTLAKALGRSQRWTRELVRRLQARGLIRPADGSEDGPWTATAASPPSDHRPGRPDVARRQVWQALMDGATLTRRVIQERTGLSASSVSGALSVLEARGQVVRRQGYWQRTARRYDTPAPDASRSPLAELPLQCRRRETSTSVQACLDCWSEAHLHAQPKDPGWQCPQGARVRLQHVWQLPVTPTNEKAVLVHALESDAGRVPRWAYVALGLSPNAETGD